MNSMTGYATHEGEFAGKKLRLELKSLNHRFLELKCRIPKELQALELHIRAEVQKTFTRGILELKAEFSAETAPLPEYSLNFALAAHYFESLTSLQKTLGMSEPIELRDLMLLPDVIARKESSAVLEEDLPRIWEEFLPHLKVLTKKLSAFRSQEGRILKEALDEAVSGFSTSLQRIRSQREKAAAGYPDKIRKRIQALFEQHPVQGADLQSVLESRISQELGLILDRTDIEEEVTRLDAHIQNLKKTISEPAPAGRRLDFIFQEMNREINTLGNKAQDLLISEEVVGLKTRIEQLREQAMNIE